MSTRISESLRRIVLAAGLVALLAGSARAASPGAPRTLIVWAGVVLAVPGKPALAGQSIVIRAGRIERISAGHLAPRDLGADPAVVDTLDLSRFTVLPGLIDLHVHLTTQPDPQDSLDEVKLGAADLALRAAGNAEKALQAGFTTVLDMGTGRRAHELAIYAVREAAASGRLTGPRILAVGSPISPPGSSRTSRYEAQVDAAIAPQGVCSGADECRRAVREQVHRGADVINVYNTGSLLAPGSPAQTFSDEELQAIVSTAHLLNRRVVADGAGKRDSAAGVNAAIRAGVDWIDTVIYPDRNTWPLLAKSKALYAPHLYAVVAAVGPDEEHLSDGSMGWLPRPVLEALLALKREPPAALAAHRAGIRMAFASDVGVFAHGLNAMEFPEYLKAGLTPAEAIATATVNAAEALGLSLDCGTLERGKRADLIAVQGDPLSDISVLSKVQAVVRAGEVIVSPTL